MRCVPCLPADPVADIHGDLTVENIICRTDVENPDKAWYIIDPNTGNLHDSPYLDYGKLLQSLARAAMSS